MSCNVLVICSCFRKTAERHPESKLSTNWKPLCFQKRITFEKCDYHSVIFHMDCEEIFWLHKEICNFCICSFCCSLLHFEASRSLSWSKNNHNGTCLCQLQKVQIKLLISLMGNGELCQPEIESLLWLFLFPLHLCTHFRSYLTGSEEPQKEDQLN